MACQHPAEHRPHVTGEVGIDYAGVHRVGGLLGAGEAPLQFFGEEQVGDLRLAVGQQRLVPLVAREVVELDGSNRRAPVPLAA